MRRMRKMKNTTLEIQRSEGRIYRTPTIFQINTHNCFNRLSISNFTLPTCFNFREFVAEVRLIERQQATREMNRNAELQHELRQSVTAMEQMIESQQRIERIQRSLAYLRDLHARMVSVMNIFIWHICNYKMQPSLP